MPAKSFPFRVDYAKTEKSSCKGCRGFIPKDELRLAVMVQPPSFFGKIPHWYHFDCFTEKINKCGDIEFFNLLEKEDKEKIKKIIGKNWVPKVKSADNYEIDKFGIQYSTNGRSICRVCKIKIKKNEIRISKKGYDAEYGDVDKWFHVDCFVAIKNNLKYFYDGTKLPGYEHLKDEDQKIIQNKLSNNQNPSQMMRNTIPESRFTRSDEEIDFGNKLDLTDTEQDQKSQRPLSGYQFAIAGKLNKPMAEIENRIQELGGEVVAKITERVLAVISNEGCVSKPTKKTEAAKAAGIYVVSSDFLDEVNAKNLEMLLHIKKICPWNGTILNITSICASEVFGTAYASEMEWMESYKNKTIQERTDFCFFDAINRTTTAYAGNHDSFFKQMKLYIDFDASIVKNVSEAFETCFTTYNQSYNSVELENCVGQKLLEICGGNGLINWG